MEEKCVKSNRVQHTGETKLLSAMTVVEWKLSRVVRMAERDKYLNITIMFFSHVIFLWSSLMIFFTTRDIWYIVIHIIYTFSIVQLYPIVRWKNRILIKLNIKFCISLFFFYNEKYFILWKNRIRISWSGGQEFYWHLYQQFSFATSIFTLRVFLEENSFCGFSPQ